MAQQYSQLVRDEKDSGVTLRGFWHILRAHWITGLVVFAVVTGLAMFMQRGESFSYVAETKVLLSVSENTSDSGADGYSGPLITTNSTAYLRLQASNAQDVCKSSSVLQPVIDELHLSMSTSQLANTISVANTQDTSILSVAASESDADSAVQIANAVSASYGKLIRQQSAQSQYALQAQTIQKAEDAALMRGSKNKFMVLGGALLGLLLGITAELIQDACSRRVKNRKDLEMHIDVPVIGEVANTADESKMKSFELISSRLTVSSPYVETHSRCFAFTPIGDSALVHTTCEIARGIACTLADSGSVLLVDATFEHNELAPVLQLREAQGFTDVLAQRLSVHDSIQHVNMNGKAVDAIAAGPVPLNAMDLMNEALVKFLSAVTADYDYVMLVTASPADGLTAAQVGADLIGVAGRQQTSYEELDALADLANDMNVSVAGMLYTEKQ